MGGPGILASFPVLNNEPQLPAKTFQVRVFEVLCHRKRQFELSLTVKGLFLACDPCRSKQNLPDVSRIW